MTLDLPLPLGPTTAEKDCGEGGGKAFFFSRMGGSRARVARPLHSFSPCETAPRAARRHMT